MTSEFVMPERLKALEMDIGGNAAGVLAREGPFVFTYRPDESGTYHMVELGFIQTMLRRVA